MIGFLLLWSFPYTNNVVFKVYEQETVAPSPYWTNTASGFQPVSQIVKTDWLTNGWRYVGTAYTTNFFIPNAGDALLHAFTITAVDIATAIESPKPYGTK